MHFGEEYNIENLEKNATYKNQIKETKSKVRNLFKDNRNLSFRDIQYESLKWPFSCSLGQIEYWLKDLISDKDGKLAHLKYQNDDLNPLIKRQWARIYDEINGILIFITDLHEDYFLDSDIWMIDDTFKTSPNEYNQVLNIMGANLLKNTYLMVAHILLNGKREIDYTNGLGLFLKRVNFLKT